MGNTYTAIPELPIELWYHIMTVLRVGRDYATHADSSIYAKMALVARKFRRPKYIMQKLLIRHTHGISILPNGALHSVDDDWMIVEEALVPGSGRKVAIFRWDGTSVRISHGLPPELCLAGTKLWFRNGLLHRKCGPAAISANPSICPVWYHSGQRIPCDELGPIPALLPLKIDPLNTNSSWGNHLLPKRPHRLPCQSSQRKYGRIL